jgi:hypothetical protein
MYCIDTFSFFCTIGVLPPVQFKGLLEVLEIYQDIRLN